MHVINYEYLWEGLVGAFLITLGIVFSEKYLDNKTSLSGRKGFGYAVAGMLIFIIGWILFLITQPSYIYGLGIVIAVITMAAQIYFISVLNLNKDKRRKLVGGTVFIWLTLLGLWLGYAYQMSLDEEKNFNGDKAALIYVGLFCLLGGTMGYLINRRYDVAALTGGMFPGMKEKTKDIFNPFVVMVMFGWSMMAMGNALSTIELPGNQDDEEPDES
jgi:glucan phosphoethanolaminetransferase (alkaline phosphatase superfamily)